MASISVRGTKWQVKIRRKGQPQLSATFASEAAARRWIAENERIDSGPTVGDLFRKYIQYPMPDRKSSDWDRRTLQRMLHKEKKLCAVPAAQLSKAHLAEWRDRRITEVLGSTVGRELDAISAAYRMAIAEWDMGIAANPVLGFRRPKLPLPREVRLMAGDDERLIGAAIDFNREIAPAIILAIETAMRQGEIAKLRWENIDLEARTAFLPETKNGTTRKVPLSTRAAEALTWCPPPHKGRVFKLTQSAMKYAFSRVREQCGLGNLHFHDLRHEAASRLFEKGLNVMEVATITGHKNLKHLQRYTHLRAEDLAKKLG
ncbi:site-specific integrase [Burkholderia sp. SIMBA_043]|uniref:site-specific integrase n=1 Tax=Burkholderia TaxID=32008 RepID=UPI0005D8247A|nr:site-specific integrase [Burkholderia vietnamiensis]AJY06028.1 phage integrase family protein [Burkholderia vietnamiensis LMG 10929]KVM43103.1 integrase [Burkholderia vietnamiensis]KVS06408.1 integrase [Burkholderia vietnamiensis]UBI27442.1 site-specific integrase [Burkholderia vietnamiensis]